MDFCLSSRGHCLAEEPKPKPVAEAEPLDPEHAKKAAESLALFKKHVKPILVQHCLDCHGGKSTKADFDLSTREKLLASGYVEKTAADSQLYKVVTHAEKPEMPFKLPKLSDEQIGHLKNWIDLGFVYDGPLVEQKDSSKGARGHRQRPQVLVVPATRCGPASRCS